MKPSLSLIIAITSLSILVSGCATNSTSKTSAESYQGVLNQYPPLHKTKAQDGKWVERWVSPKMQQHQIDHVLLEPIYLPHNIVEQPENFSPELINEVETYLNQKLRDLIGNHTSITDTAGPGVVRMRVALTGIRMHTQGLQPNEIIPFRAILASIEAAADRRDQDILVHLETELTDSETGELLFAAVRQEKAAELPNRFTNAQLKDFELLIDRLSDYAAQALRDRIESRKTTNY